MLIDTHCHLTFAPLRDQVTDVLARARAADVRQVINVATTIAEARAGLELLRSFPEVDLVAGIHPHEAGHCTSDDLAALAALHRGEWAEQADAERLVGVGETGLDFHYDFAPRARQEEVFRFHLALAVQVGRPVVIHARASELRVCEMLADYPQLAGRVVFHCFSAGVDIARRVLDLGGYLSFTGVVTFKKAETVRAAARFAPQDRILVETDAPYLSPEPVRKTQPNEPAFVVHTARFLAELRGESLDELAGATTANAIRCFGLPKESA